MENKENIIGKIKTLLRFSNAESEPTKEISTVETSEFPSIDTSDNESISWTPIKDYCQSYYNSPDSSAPDSNNLSNSISGISNFSSGPTAGSIATTWSTWTGSYSTPVDNSYLYEEFLKSLENYINDKLEEIEDKVKDLLSMIKENPKEYSNSLYPLMQYQIGQKESLLNISKYIKENKERISL